MLLNDYFSQTHLLYSWQGVNYYGLKCRKYSVINHNSEYLNHKTDSKILFRWLT